MNPITVGSMIIVVPGVERVVIAIPARFNGVVVATGDVLVAAYYAAQERVGHHGEYGKYTWGSSRLTGKHLEPHRH